MRFDIFGRFEIELTRDGATWKALSVGEGKRKPLNLPIPPDLKEDELQTYLDDLFHEFATPGRTIRRVG